MFKIDLTGGSLRALTSKTSSGGIFASLRNFNSKKTTSQEQNVSKDDNCVKSNISNEEELNSSHSSEQKESSTSLIRSILSPKGSHKESNQNRDNSDNSFTSPREEKQVNEETPSTIPQKKLPPQQRKLPQQRPPTPLLQKKPLPDNRSLSKNVTCDDNAIPQIRHNVKKPRPTPSLPQKIQGQKLARPLPKRGVSGAHQFHSLRNLPSNNRSLGEIKPAPLSSSQEIRPNNRGYIQMRGKRGDSGIRSRGTQRGRGNRPLQRNNSAGNIVIPEDPNSENPNPNSSKVQNTTTQRMPIKPHPPPTKLSTQQPPKLERANSPSPRKLNHQPELQTVNQNKSPRLVKPNMPPPPPQKLQRSLHPQNPQKNNSIHTTKRIEGNKNINPNAKMLKNKSLTIGREKPSRAPAPNLARSRTSIYHGLSQRQSIVLEEMDKEWSDVESTVFAAVVSESDEADDDDELIPGGLEMKNTNEETREALASIDVDMPDVSMFNLEEPGEYETSRRLSRHSSIKPGAWEGWQRRVKRQTWEEWEQRMTYNVDKKLKLSNCRTKNSQRSSEMPQARNQQELDGRQVTPYWLIHWWLTKNSTERPTVSKHPLLELILDNLHVIDALTEVTSGIDLNKLAYALVCIFDGCGKVMTLINHVITKEIQATTHSNTLLRTNSITTKIISSYSKIAGVVFIRKLLSPLIQEIVDSEIYIEIDSKKLVDLSDLQYQQQKLLDISQKFIDRIVSSIDIVPYAFRQICNCLSIMISDKFSKETSFFGIGGFIFLRFICPAIVAPEAFGLLKKPPQTAARRTLILISKIIQHLANGAKQTKEDYMNECTNIFVSKNEEILFNYYEKLSTVPPLPPTDDSSAFSLIPIPLVEEALTITHRLVLLKIDEIKELLTDIDEVENVTYNVFENMSTVILKSNIILESMRLHDIIDSSSPLFKPYSLLIDVILADGCKIVTTVIANLPQIADREALAEALMVIVHQHGDSVNFIKTLISKDIQCASSIDNVLSGTSLSNLLLSGFLKVITREFIINHWAPVLQEINHSNEYIELDPHRAPSNYDFMKANETIADTASKLLNSLLSNENCIHQQAREICAYAQLKLIQKFGSNSVDPNYGAKLICNRVFIPAVSYPNLFHILPNFPPDNARRSFILISMLLRNSFHGTICDEGYVVGLNHTVLSLQDNVNIFYKTIAKPINSSSDSHQLSPQAQAEAILILHHWISVSQDTLKNILKDTTNKESIIYNVFDRLAAVIALYRFRLRRRIASGVNYYYFFLTIHILILIFFF